MGYASTGGTEWVQRVADKNNTHMTVEEDGGRRAFCGAGDGSSRSMVTLVKEWKTTRCQRCRKKAGIDSYEKQVIADYKIYRTENKELKKEIKRLKLELGVAREAHLSTIMKG